MTASLIVELALPVIDPRIRTGNYRVGACHVEFLASCWRPAASLDLA